MLKRCLILLATMLASTTYAADSITDLGPPTTGSLAASRTLYRFIVVGDIQNMVSSVISGAPDGATCVQNLTNNCTAHCDDSIYCKNDWNNTNGRVLRNLAYDITGQWSRIDWSEIDGAEGRAVTNAANPKGPEGTTKPDFILVVGDLGDQGDGHSLATTYANSTAPIKLEGERYWQNFISILEDSGIPYVSARGNHDAPAVFANYFTDTRWLAKAGIYDSNATQHQFALKATMGDGRQICLVTAECAGGVDEEIEVEANIGCGASLPTILVAHIITDSSGSHEDHGSTASQVACNEDDARNWYNDVVNNAANTEIVGIVSGHFTSGTPINNIFNFISPAGWVGGEDIFDIFENLQEMPRVMAGAGGVFGNTSKDSAGGVYRMCTIDRAASTISCVNWSPWLRSHFSNVPSSWQGSPNTTFPLTQGTYSPSWTTRFP